MDFLFRILIAMSDFIGVAIFFFLGLVVLLVSFILNLFPFMRKRKKE